MQTGSDGEESVYFAATCACLRTAGKVPCVQCWVSTLHLQWIQHGESSLISTTDIEWNECLVYCGTNIVQAAATTSFFDTPTFISTTCSVFAAVLNDVDTTEPHFIMGQWGWCLSHHLKRTARRWQHFAPCWRQSSHQTPNGCSISVWLRVPWHLRPCWNKLPLALKNLRATKQLSNSRQLDPLHIVATHH